MNDERFKKVNRIVEAYFNAPLPSDLQSLIRAWFVQDDDREEKDAALSGVFEKTLKFDKTTDHSLDSAYLKVCRKIGYYPDDISKFRKNLLHKPSFRRAAYRVVAVVIPVLVAVSVIFMNRRGREIQQTLTVVESVNHIQKVFLPDGSYVILNSNSRLSYNEQRFADLTGEGYFRIAKSDTPFVVRTNNLDVNVYGTEFILTAFPDNDLVEVSLYSGSVVLESDGERTELKPDQKFRLNKESGEQVLIAMDRGSLDYLPQWYLEMNKYVSRPLGDIFRLIDSMYGVSIQHNNLLNLEEQYVLPLHECKTLQEVMMELQEISGGFQYIKQGNTIIIKSPTQN